MGEGRRLGAAEPTTVPKVLSTHAGLVEHLTAMCTGYNLPQLVREERLRMAADFARRAAAHAADTAVLHHWQAKMANSTVRVAHAALLGLVWYRF